MSASAEAELFTANPNTTEQSLANQIKLEIENNEKYDVDAPVKRFRLRMSVEEVALLTDGQ
jgi:hypothetical protein